MAEVNDLSVVDASNTARFPEDQAASSVNNGARALEGLIARWAKDTDGSLASTGSANAYLLAANQTLSAYYDGLTLCFEANFTNTGSATLNVDSVGAQAIVRIDGSALIGGEIPIDGKALVKYEATNTRWQLINPALGLPFWQTIQRKTASASATIDFESLSPTVYEAYRVSIFGLRPATDATAVYLRVGTGATPTYQSASTDYGYSGTLLNTAGGFVGFGSAGGTAAQIFLNTAGAGFGVGNAADEHMNLTLEFSKVDNASFDQLFNFHGSYIAENGGLLTTQGGGHYLSPTAVTAIRFLMSSGNITEGVFVLEGLRI